MFQDGYDNCHIQFSWERGNGDGLYFVPNEEMRTLPQYKLQRLKLSTTTRQYIVGRFIITIIPRAQVVHELIAKRRVGYQLITTRASGIIDCFIYKSSLFNSRIRKLLKLGGNLNYLSMAARIDFIIVVSL